MTQNEASYKDMLDATVSLLYFLASFKIYSPHFSAYGAPDHIMERHVREFVTMYRVIHLIGDEDEIQFQARRRLFGLPS